VYDGTFMNFYLNGSRVHQVAITNTNQAANIYIGNSLNPTSQNFVGYMSNLRVLKGVAQYNGTTYTIPTEPFTSDVNTSLLTLQSGTSITDASNNVSTISNYGSVTASFISPFSTANGTTVYDFTSPGSITFGNVGGPKVFIPPTVVEYLIVGGGGAGGYGDNGQGGGGGGGAGGLLTGTASLTLGSGYAITVGGGGAAVNNNSGTFNPGNPSTFFGLTALGGGAGNAQSGGSGGGAFGRNGNAGGAGSGFPGIAGTTQQGFPGAPAVTGTAPTGAGGTGGGGAGSASISNSGPSGTAGGSGYTWPLTGNIYAGGGGGGAQTSGTGGTGGTGGGGNGQSPSTMPAGSAGTPGTGGGGGGNGSGVGTSGAGGSGVVILAVPTPQYPGSAPGATVTTPPAAPGMTVLTYTAASPLTPSTFTFTA
jgi:hypothetical protein